MMMRRGNQPTWLIVLLVFGLPLLLVGSGAWWMATHIGVHSRPNCYRTSSC